ncbi:MAG: indolepyruvate ferredoxin oxidoreductase subunit alpha [Desulfurococcales archaeon]|nr:indolepyruvate ferredoxin oxidoreductase subunit alpha [Desulfurococcales archaeon]
MVSKGEFLAPAGTTRLLLGNEAIARGAIEAGVGFVAGYPGTPSTEIIETLSKVARDLEIHVEWSTNEKVALEAVYGAQLAGVRAMAVMKHVGLNVAADPFMTLSYTGVVGGTVVVTADDPSMWSSQNEQDNRYYGMKSYTPVFEPSDPGEAKELIKTAFEFSEKHGHPVLYRTTTRISHVRGPVRMNDIPLRKTKGEFRKNPERFTMIPAHARIRRRELISRWPSIIADLESFEPFNRIENPGNSIAIMASGLAYSYAREALESLGYYSRVTLVKVATPFPVTRSLLKPVLEAEKVLVVEELEPVVEMQVRNSVQEQGADVKIYGKELIPLIGELTLDKVAHGIAKFLGINTVPVEISGEPHVEQVQLPPRPPAMCPGCPHRGTYYALRKAVNKARVKPVYSGDIGCYSLGVLPPFREQDTIIEMGGSIGLGNGFSHTLDKQFPIAIIGDSTFFHSGVTGLINTVYNKAPLLIIVLDNRVTGMTGEQPHPGTGLTATFEETVAVSIKNIAKAVGVEHVEEFDPFNIKESTETIYKAIKYVLENRKPALLVARRACALEVDRRAKRKNIANPIYQVISDKCTGCGVCYNAFTCPAIMVAEDKKAYIDETLCTGCGVCAEVCPFDAIVKIREGDPEWYDLWNI